MKDWRCLDCRKLLGKLQIDGRLHIRMAGFQYAVSLPASSVCRRCDKLNELPFKSADTVPVRSPLGV